MTKNTLIERLFSVGAHFGYAARYRHPSTTSFLFGAKGSVELFDLEKTASLLDQALAFVKSLAAEKKVILFVSGKAESRDTLRRVAERIGQPYASGRWIGGTLTNWNEIKKRLARLEEHIAMRDGGQLAKFTKRERLLIDREITDLEAMFGGLRGMSKLPDALVIVDPRAEKGAAEEARQLNIPVVAFLNSDCDASSIQYPIPGNDASAAAVTLVLDEIAKAYQDATPAA
ncbi:30S ribosomal protein S2 [Candidatus Nomurabacteria bacterium]|nr:30S ribosomal protein S2 [Candidatus Nomurabacteria bacterium]